MIPTHSAALDHQCRAQAGELNHLLEQRPEVLALAFATKGKPGRALLAGWLAWARRSRLPKFVNLAKTITHYLPLIHNTLDTGLGNARSEATNTHLRLLARRSYGFHSADALNAMANLTRGGLCPPLPGRS